MLLPYLILNLILISFVNIYSSNMCYSKLDSVLPNVQNLSNLSTVNDIEDNCDYLDIDSHM